jgi:dTDP-4-dehydrorhamnose 3,5-epimerase
VIEGVTIKRLRVIPDQRGRLMEILRNDDEQFQKFGQVYITTAFPDVVKGWHYHRIQYDNLCPLTGTVQIALYDSRKDSPTHREVNVFHCGIHNPILVHVPPLVFHGFKNVGTEEALILNCPTETYQYDQPDEYRVDPYDNDIPHDWRRRDG